MNRRSLARVVAVAALLGLLAPVHRARAQFDSTAWRFSGDTARVVRHLGREALLLINGLAEFRGAPFENGTVELDIAVSSAFGFTGVQFRMTGPRDYEHFYLRPFMSGNPDATQYEPVIHGNTGWQIYVGDRYTAPLRFRFDEWMHLRLVFDGTRAAVYLGTDSTPSQLIPALLRTPTAGRVALSATFAPVYVSNVRVQPGVVTPIPSRTVSALPAPPGAITAWAVSSPFDEQRLTSSTSFPGDVARRLTWSSATASERGIVNLGALAARDSAQNTVVAALTLRSDSARVQPITFGFSDRVRIYLNGRLLYAGNDGYRTRDYRFLGTVGLFDTVYLPLQPGDNSLWLAVSESFGGWAVTAEIDPAPGVRVSAPTP